MASRSKHQEDAEKYLELAKRWLPDPGTDGQAEFRENSMMCDLYSRIAQVHATLAGK